MRSNYFLIFLFGLASCATNTEMTSRGNNCCVCAPVAAKIGCKVAPVGSYLDEQSLRSIRASPRTYQRMERGEPLTVDDVIKLHQADVSDAAIARYIGDSDGHYSLNETQIRRLRAAGISESLIDYMRRGGR